MWSKMIIALAPDMGQVFNEVLEAQVKAFIKGLKHKYKPHTFTISICSLTLFHFVFIKCDILLVKVVINLKLFLKKFIGMPHHFVVNTAENPQLIDYLVRYKFNAIITVFKYFLCH